jgi:hypothetical protein
VVFARPGGARWWAVSLGEHDGVAGVGLWWLGEILVSLADTDVVTPAGAALPS